MGRAAYPTGTAVLPAPAREEAEQREHENDDQDDPENAQCSHLLPAFVSQTTDLRFGGCVKPRGASLVAERANAKDSRSTAPRRFSSHGGGQRQAMPRAIWTGSISF